MDGAAGPIAQPEPVERVELNGSDNDLRVIVPGDEIPREDDLNKVNSKLNKGLETCRSVVANYRTLLSGDPKDAGDQRISGLESEADSD